ncbi:hypothetical protein QUF80_11130 [Desulfococcaceae bacterium HSG8]|nr:hypothetical protein [Desulfococcaceae bacterium HSG8]
MLKELKTKISDALENLVTLEIMTAVGHVKPPDEEKMYPDIDYTRDPKIMLSRIDLLQGDIRTICDEEFIRGDYRSLREFHAEREKEGHRIVMQNIDTLERLLKLVKDHLEE